LYAVWTGTSTVTVFSTVVVTAAFLSSRDGG